MKREIKAICLGLSLAILLPSVSPVMASDIGVSENTIISQNDIEESLEADSYTEISQEDTSVIPETNQEVKESKVNENKTETGMEEKEMPKLKQPGDWETDEYYQENRKWNCQKKYTKQQGAFTFHYVISKDKKKAWIYYIKVDINQDHSTLNIPENIDGKKVTRLGWLPEVSGKPVNYDSDYKNIFGQIVIVYDDDDIECYNENRNYPNKKETDMTSLNIPNSVTRIEEFTFANMHNLESVSLPGKIKDLYPYTFLKCTKLKSVQLPSGLSSMCSEAFWACPKIKQMKINSTKKFYVKNHCLIQKSNKKVIYAFAGVDTIEVPKGVKIIGEKAFYDIKIKKVTLPSTLKKIEYRGLTSSYITKVVLSKSNPYLKKSGNTIYDIKTKTLVLANLNKKEVYKMSNKVEIWNGQESYVGFIKSEPNSSIDLKFYVSSNLKKIDCHVNEDIIKIPHVYSFYMTSPTPPQWVNLDDLLEEDTLNIQFFVKKEWKDSYQKWVLQFNPNISEESMEYTVQTY